MLATNRVVKEIILIANTREPLDRRPEQFKLATALIGVVNDAQSSQTEVRRRHELRPWLWLRKCERPESPQIEFVVSRETIESADPHRRFLPIPVLVREEVSRLMREVWLKRQLTIEWAECVLDERQLSIR